MAGDDKLYAAWIRRQPCVYNHLGKCLGATQAHHDNVHMKGLGLRASDRTAIPFCALHHREWHDVSGAFEDYTKPMRKAWTDQWVDHFRHKYEREVPQPLPVEEVCDDLLDDERSPF